MDDIEDLDEQIDEYIEQGIQWAEHPAGKDNPHGARFFKGTTPSASFVLTSFDIEHQGFPPGSRGYDGTISRGTLIVRLTREQSERLFKNAESTSKTSA